eukprot:TRINITY_DN4231_c0_g1_i1.p1 TRINITY_DN4231_c0_g1~~TRINITY_DN4231_c0_g1_i1.p1  ORF type:complete len:316 (-),score=30.51 TRINITY_DN4231_c0_g1_i1:313-1209(-)
MPYKLPLQILINIIFFFWLDRFVVSQIITSSTHNNPKHHSFAMASDPYPEVKQLILKDLDRVERLKLSAEAKQPGALTALSSSCKELEQEVRQLEGVVAACLKNPFKFGLNYEEANQRQNEVQSMRNRFNTVKQFMQQQKQQQGYVSPQVSVSSTPSTLTKASVEMSNQEQDQLRLLGTQNKANSSSQPVTTGNSQFDNEYQQQQLTIQQQDVQLEGMTKQVDNVKQLAVNIGDELKDQQKMINELDEEVEITGNRLQAAILRIDTVIKKSGVMCQMITIISLIVILIVLVCWVFGIF